HTQYFYSLTGEWEEESWKTIQYRRDGHTIIMSRGMGVEVLNEAQATALLPETEFTLSLDGVSLMLTTGKSVDKLANGYHVVQSFSLGVMSRGSHTLIGFTDLKQEGISRTNRVNLTVK
ncbi:MAG: hypothetical protein WCS35_06990, partial [Sphaerochaeta sp.]